jgi:hypothetical protein
VTLIKPALASNPSCRQMFFLEKARKENLTPSDRHLLRLEKAKPLLEQIKIAVQAARGDALPKSALAKAFKSTHGMVVILSRVFYCGGEGLAGHDLS